nr:GIY-YIG nuclease family protein [uncultured Aminipila sp.]
MEKKNFVYILECSDGTYYTGWTINLEERIRIHNEGTGPKAAKYTRGRRPVRLVYFEEYENKSEALKRECSIKKLTRAGKKELINSKIVL